MPSSEKSSRIVKFIKLWLPVLLCMGVIFYTSSIVATDIPALFPFQDILFHLLIYGIMAYFFAEALKNSFVDFSLLKAIYFTLFFGVIFGISDEIHQMFVPGRNASGLDLFIDGIGSLLGSFLGFIYGRDKAF